MALELRQTVLDAPDARMLAEFYRELLGWPYRPGDEPPDPGDDDPHGRDWLVLRAPDSGSGLAFQHVDELARSTWPDARVPQQLHLDLTVDTAAELQAEYDRALSLGATPVLDRSDDPDEPLHVFVDPAGHPFCVFVG